METRFSEGRGATNAEDDADEGSISLVLPAKNEEECLRQAITEAHRALDELTGNFEIIVVDDGSDDGTFRVAQDVAQSLGHTTVVRHVTNQGYGAAIRTGFAMATKQLVAFTDSDCQFDLRELDRFIFLAKDYDVVCGYRMDRKDTWLRCAYSKGYNILVRGLLDTGLRDVDCALKCFRRSSLDKVEITTNGFLVNSELITTARQNGLSIVEVGVSHRPRRDGQSTVSVAHIPVVLISLLRYWWNAFIFPGCDAAEAERRQPNSDAWPSWPAVLLISIAAMILFSNLGYPLIDRDETRYAEIPREMLTSGNWVLPQLNFEPYYDKPPLFYWLCALSYEIFGISEQSVRFVVAASGLSTVVLTLWFGSRIFGRRAGWLGAMALLVSFGFLFCGRFLIIDSVLSVLVALSLFAAYEAIRRQRLQWRWWTLSAIACGAGILTKGPVAAVLVGPPVLAYAFLTSGVTQLRTRHWFAFGAMAAAVALPWFVAVSIQDSSFLYEFLYKHNISRFAGAYHTKPFWFYIPVVLAGAHPWTFLAVPYAMFLLSRNRETQAMRPSAMGFLLLWSAWCTLFFSISKCKLPAYILPAAPAFALLVGHYLDHMVSQATTRSTQPLFRIAKCLSPWMSTVTTCIVALILGVVANRMGLMSTPILYLAAVCWSVALLAAVVLAVRFTNNWQAGWGITAVLAAALAGQVTHEWLPALGASEAVLTADSSFAKWLGDSGTPIVTFGDELSSIPFYSARNDIPNYRQDDLPRLVEFVNQHRRSVLVVSTNDHLPQLDKVLPPNVTLSEIGKRGEARILLADKNNDAIRVAHGEVPKYDLR